MHDRLIVAASRRLAATVITKDRIIQASPQRSRLSDHVYPWQPPCACHVLAKSYGSSLRVHVHTRVAGDGGLAPHAVGPALDDQLARLVAADGSGHVVRPPCRSRKVASTCSPSSVCSVSSPRRLPCRTQFRSTKPLPASCSLTSPMPASLPSHSRSFRFGQTAGV